MVAALRRILCNYLNIQGPEFGPRLFTSHLTAKGRHLEKLSVKLVFRCMPSCVFVFSCAFSGDCVAPRTAVLCLSLDIFTKDCNFTCASIPQRNRESITFRIYSDGRMLSVYVCVCDDWNAPRAKHAVLWWLKRPKSQTCCLLIAETP